MSEEVRVWFDPSGSPLGEQDEWPVVGWLHPATFSVTYTLQDVSVDALAILCGIPLVDASIMWEPHLVRGTQ